MFVPVTHYTLGCNTCPALFESPEDDDLKAVLFLRPHLCPAHTRWLTREGWLVTGTRVLCPVCVAAAADVAVQRLEIEVTHEPLFDVDQLGAAAGPAPAPAHARWSWPALAVVLTVLAAVLATVLATAYTLGA